MIGDDLLKLAIPALIAAIASIPVLWAKYFSARVTLRTDLRLLKVARESGIDTKIMEAGIHAQIKAIYTKGSDDSPAIPEPNSVGGNLFVALICLVFSVAGSLGAVDGIQKGLSDGAGDLVIGSLIGGFFGFGTFVCVRDAVALVRKRRAEAASPETKTAT